MVKSKKLQRQTNPRRRGARLHKLSRPCKKVYADDGAHYEKLRMKKASEKREWQDAICSVCLEVPHNAVLLLCSSYDTGCRPYMCATSHRYSNCLEQYRKAYTKETSDKNTQQQSLQEGTLDDDMDFFLEESGGSHVKKTEEAAPPELLCPLCRGQVKGWTVVDPARRCLNAKKRNCTQDDCSFVGTYKEIKKHVKSVHPLARPREVDPTHAEKWKNLENERALRDVLSSIRSSMPGAIVLGDYVIEAPRGVAGDYGGDGFLDEEIFGFPGYSRSWGGTMFASDGFEEDYEALDEEYLRRLQARARGRNYSRIARPHARLLFARQSGRSRGRGR